MGASHAALWRSAFRPFFLLGALYAPLLAAAGVAAWSAGVALPAHWHAHEMLFGFATAIVVGVLLTALPSWAGTPELHGARLATLAALWLAGRVAFWVSPWLPPAVVAAADLGLPLLLAAWLAPPLWRVPRRAWRAVLPIVLALAVANAVFHVAAGDAVLAQRALRAALWVLVLLFTLGGGLLTPVFTGNALRASGRGAPAPTAWPLEAAALAALLALAAADVAGVAGAPTAALALAAFVLHGWRVARWRGWRAFDAPLVAGLHAGFAWLLLAFALKALADFGLLPGAWPDTLWVHAFTVGALGQVMLSLMTRVALRHTGRALHPPRALAWTGWAVAAATLVRLVAAALGEAAWLGAALLPWAAAFAGWAAVTGRWLVAPSLPRAAAAVVDHTTAPGRAGLRRGR